MSVYQEFWATEKSIRATRIQILWSWRATEYLRSLRPLLTWTWQSPLCGWLIFLEESWHPLNTKWILPRKWSSPRKQHQIILGLHWRLQFTTSFFTSKLTEKAIFSKWPNYASTQQSVTTYTRTVDRHELILEKCGSNVAAAAASICTFCSICSNFLLDCPSPK